MTPARFKAAREGLGLSVDELAALLGRSPRAVQRWEMPSDAPSSRAPDPLASRILHWLLIGVLDLDAMRANPMPINDHPDGEPHLITGAFVSRSGRTIETERKVVVDARRQLLFTPYGDRYEVETAEDGALVLLSPGQKPFYVDRGVLEGRGWVGDG